MNMTIKLATGLALVSLLAGCVVTSVYPFYTDKDVVFDPALVGTVPGSTNAASDHWRFERLNQQAYWLTIGEINKTNRYETHRFRIKQHVFLDLRTANRVDEQLPLHYLIKIETTGAKLQIKPLNFEWLAKLLEKHPQALRHILCRMNPVIRQQSTRSHGGNAGTGRALSLKHINDTNTFGVTTELTRWKD